MGSAYILPKSVVGIALNGMLISQSLAHPATGSNDPFYPMFGTRNNPATQNL